MRIIKPQALGLIHRPVTLGRTHYLCVTALAMFRFDQPTALQHEAALWQLAADEAGDDGAAGVDGQLGESAMGAACLDEGCPKSGAEVIVSGVACPVGGPQAVCDVRLQLASIDKTLRVFGARRWTLAGVPSDPLPFSQLRLDWAYAFGGRAIADGYLPQIMRPGERLLSPTDPLVPAGFSARMPNHPERQRYVGHYDAAWLAQRAPHPPEDFDARFYFTAAADQWLAAALRGDESFVVEHMHPERPRIEGRLPSLLVRCLVSGSGSGAELREVPMRLDTVRLFPHREAGILSFRGTVQVVEDDADDLKLLMIGCEHLNQRREDSHYERALMRRLGAEEAAMAVLDDADLLPLGCAAPPAPDAAALSMAGTLHSRIMQRTKDEVAAARQQLRDAGMEPDAHDWLCEPPGADGARESARGNGAGEDNQLPANLSAQAAEERQRAEQYVREQCAANGLDLDAMTAEAREQASRPPSFSSVEIVASLRAQQQLAQNAGIALPAIEWFADDGAASAQLDQLERQLRDSYRRYAHLGPRPTPRAEDATQGRKRLCEAVGAGQPLAGVDLSCADLSGLDLSGANLAGAWLAGAQLRQCNLDGACLDDAVLAFADLTEARLERAHIHGANLGEAVLCRTILHDCSLSHSTLAGADLTQACLQNAQLHELELDRCVLAGADMRGTRSSKVRADHATWLAVDLREAVTEDGLFLGFAAPNSQLAGAKWQRCCFVDVDLRGASMQGVVLRRCAVIGQVTFAGADLRNATFEQISLRGADLTRANLREATLRSVDLSKANLSGASLYRACATDVIWQRTRLEDAVMISLAAPYGIFQHALLAGADLSGSNVYGADFSGAQIDERTRFTDAMCVRAQRPRGWP